MIFNNPDLEIDIPDLSLPRFVLQHALEYGSRLAVIDGANGRVITYAQLHRQVRHAAKSLIERGYRKGDVFAIFSPNVPEYIVAFHAIATIGGVILTGNPLHPPSEIEAQIRPAGAKCLLTTSPFVEKALGMKERGLLREIFTFDHSPHAAAFAELYESVMAPSEVATNALIDPPKDPVMVHVPLDTPEASRIVQHTHGALVGDLCRFAAGDSVSAEDIFLGVMPIYQNSGRLLLLGHALRHGACVITFPRFRPDLFLRAIAEHRVTRVPVTPILVEMLSAHPLVEQYDLSSLKTIYSLAGLQCPEVAHRCANRLQCQVKLV